MNHKRFTLISAYQEFDLTSKPREGYDTIQEVIEWCNRQQICYDDVCITEWNIEGGFDGYGIPDIVATVNLANAVLDGAEDLSRYSTY